MPSYLKDNLPTLMYLNTPGPYKHAVLLKASPDLVHTIKEVAHNTLYGRITLTDEERQALSANKVLIQRFLKAKNTRLYLLRHRDLLLPLLLPPAIRCIYGEEDEINQ